MQEENGILIKDTEIFIKNQANTIKELAKSKILQLGNQKLELTESQLQLLNQLDADSLYETFKQPKWKEIITQIIPPKQYVDDPVRRFCDLLVNQYFSPEQNQSRELNQEKQIVARMGRLQNSLKNAYQEVRSGPDVDFIMDLLLKDSKQSGNSETEFENDNTENQIYEQMHDGQSDLESGYSTISSGTDQDELVENQKARAEEIILRQAQIKQDQAQKLKDLQAMLQKQSQLKAAEKLSAKLNARNDIRKDKNFRHSGIISISNPNVDAEQTLDDQISGLVSRANAAQNNDMKVFLGNPNLKKDAGKAKIKGAHEINLLSENLADGPLGQFEAIILGERFAGYKNKNQLTIRSFSQKEIEFYRIQESERYKIPQKPWVYYTHDGETSIVGPVVKKNKNGAQISFNNKPRDHPQLHSNRPGIVTLLCLARDAASRLPDGIGTRADILELIKHSQWLKIDGIDPTQLNNIVSGALDRLHYEPDPCVKYDSDRKLWIYLHKDRNLDHEEWKIQPEPNQIEINCLVNNAIDLQKIDSKFDEYSKNEANQSKWKKTRHREVDTPEVRALIVRQKEMIKEQEARRLKEIADKAAQELKEAQQKTLAREMRLLEMQNESRSKAKENKQKQSKLEKAKEKKLAAEQKKAKNKRAEKATNKVDRNKIQAKVPKTSPQKLVVQLNFDGNEQFQTQNLVNLPKFRKEIKPVKNVPQLPSLQLQNNLFSNNIDQIQFQQGAQVNNIQKSTMNSGFSKLVDNFMTSMGQMKRRNERQQPQQQPKAFQDFLPQISQIQDFQPQIQQQLQPQQLQQPSTQFLMNQLLQQQQAQQFLQQNQVQNSYQQNQNANKRHKR